MIGILNRKKNVLLLMAVLVCGGGNLLMLGGLNKDVYTTLAQTNFITTVPNVIVLVLIFSQLVSYNRISNLLITRVKLTKYLTSQLMLSMSLGLVYLGFQYALNLWLLPVEYPARVGVIYLYLLINMVLFLFEIMVMNLINFGMNPVFVFAVALGMNFIWHYAFVMNIISKWYVEGII